MALGGRPGRRLAAGTAGHPVNAKEADPALARAARALCARHGLPFTSVRPLAVGAANEVYALSTGLVLRVALAGQVVNPEREAALSGAARACGVRTPKVIAWAGPGNPFGRAYIIFERVYGELLDLAPLTDSRRRAACRALGGDLARWHARRAPSTAPLAGLPRDAPRDPRTSLSDLTRAGRLDRDSARWLEGWFNRLASQALPEPELVLLHGDVRPTNVLVTPKTGRYTALIDWGDAHWGDPAAEFATLSLSDAAATLAGYRRGRPGQEDVSEARILWVHLSWAISALAREPRPQEQIWSAPPAARLLHLTRFFLDGAPPAWRSLLR